MEKLVLIDGNSLINRAFYAMPLLTTREGAYTNAVYGFMNMFFKMINEIKPTKIAVAFDVHAPTFRHLKYSEYKGTRKPMPEELRPQIPLLKDTLKLMGITVVEKAGLEADDLIGTIAKNTDIKTVIFTGDKDSFQLVDQNTEVHFTKRGITDTEIYDAENFKEKTGIDPIQIIDLKGLMGDSSDNIPGVKGVGEKTALTLIQKYRSVENLYEHTEELTGKLYEKITEGKDSAFTSKDLATINIHADFDYDIEKMGYSYPFSEEVKRTFMRLEFKSLYQKEQLFTGGGTAEKKSVNLAEATESELPVTEIKRILSVEEYPDLTESAVSLVINKNSINVSDGKTEYVLPVKETLLDEGLDLSTALRLTVPLLNRKKPLFVYDKKSIRHFYYDNIGESKFDNAEDLALVKYLADFSGKNEPIESVLVSYGADEKTPATSLYSLAELFFQKLKDENQEDLYYKVELPLSDILFDMEVAGFKVDYDALNVLGEKYKTRLISIEKQIRNYAEDDTLNVNSPKRLGELLFEKLKIGKGKKTKTGYSTTAEVLEQFESAHPVIPLILTYRRIQKLYSTYIEGLKPLIDKTTGIIHTSFNQTVTTTGRLSSKEPNLQNIPVRDDEGKELRKFFVPKSKDRILIGADYSQIELRLLAAFSNCKPLIDAFKNGKDVHSETASKVFKVPIAEVTPDMRRNAKAVNFGVIYGISEYGLAKNIGVSPAEARNYITSYFNEYPEVKAYMDKNVEFARSTGYAITTLGRKRYIGELNSSNRNLQQFGERAAMNMPLQGSAADVIKLAMIGVKNRLIKEGLKSELILQVHDELIIDAYKSEREQVEKLLKEEMENAVKLSVPLTVSAEVGETWYDAK